MLGGDIPSWVCLYGSYNGNCTFAEAAAPWTIFLFYTIVIFATFIHALNQIGTEAADINEEATARHRKHSESFALHGLSFLAQLAVGFGGVFWKPSQYKAFHPFQSDVVQILGVLGLLACCIGFILVHFDLGANWSPTPEVKASHELVTSGIFRWARHPMYAVFTWLAVFSAVATLNWIIGLCWLSFALPTYYRIPTEEKLLVELFGEQYREYQNKVSALGFLCCCCDRLLSHGKEENPSRTLLNNELTLQEETT